MNVCPRESARCQKVEDYFFGVLFSHRYPLLSRTALRVHYVQEREKNKKRKRRKHCEEVHWAKGPDGMELQETFQEVEYEDLGKTVQVNQALRVRV